MTKLNERSLNNEVTKNPQKRSSFFMFCKPIMAIFFVITLSFPAISESNHQNIFATIFLPQHEKLISIPLLTSLLLILLSSIMTRLLLKSEEEEADNSGIEVLTVVLAIITAGMAMLTAFISISIFLMPANTVMAIIIAISAILVAIWATATSITKTTETDGAETANITMISIELSVISIAILNKSWLTFIVLNLIAAGAFLVARYLRINR
jgi:hypothetical protein